MRNVGHVKICHNQRLYGPLLLELVSVTNKQYTNKQCIAYSHIKKLKLNSQRTAFRDSCPNTDCFHSAFGLVTVSYDLVVTEATRKMRPRENE
ncbi:hypothetical protein J6590_088690 [Homalodisca vitripennis]|nr:hypothetical protein J6590_088690 [Homalodisca vitripennis]